MKWLLTFNIYLAAAGLAAAQPMPMAGTLPHPVPLSTSPTVASPSLSGSTSWPSENYHAAPAASCGKQGCGTPQCGAKGGSAFERFCEWISFRPGAPVHTMCVPQPPRAPLRSYFSNSACGVGCANALDFNTGCAKGSRGCSKGNETVNIPLPKRSCASANCGGNPMWGRGSSSCGLMGSLKSFFGLSEGSCGTKGCGSGACGSSGSGCSHCQYSKTPMNDIGQYHSFTVTQSVGRTNGLTNTGAAPAGSHYANPYKAASAELQYSQPGASLAPATPMHPPQPPMSQGTNPFPGQNGSLPYNRPFTNP